MNGDSRHTPRLGDDEKLEILNMVRQGQSPAAVVSVFERRRDRKTVMYWVTGFRYATHPNIRVPGSLKYGLTRQAISQMAEFASSHPYEDGLRSHTAPDAAPHTRAVLNGRDALVALIRATPDPDTVLADFRAREDRTTWIAPQSAQWPGLETPSGFAMLVAHTRHDPQWKQFGLVPREDTVLESKKDELPWIFCYEQSYLRPLLNLVGMSHMVYQERVAVACRDLYNSGPMLYFPAFVLRPIRDVIRMLMGLGPLGGGAYSVEYQNPGPMARGYRLEFGGELIAAGVDQRPGAGDDAVVNAVMTLHSSLAERLWKASEPQTIVAAWQDLEQRGRQFVTWLESLKPSDIERGDCRVCRHPHSGIPLMPELQDGVRRFLAGGPAATPDELVNEGHGHPSPTQNSTIQRFVIDGTATVQPGQPTRIATVHTDGRVDYGRDFSPTPPKQAGKPNTSNSDQPD